MHGAARVNDQPPPVELAAAFCVQHDVVRVRPFHPPARRGQPDQGLPERERLGGGGYPVGGRALSAGCARDAVGENAQRKSQAAVWAVEQTGSGVEWAASVTHVHGATIGTFQVQAADAREKPGGVGRELGGSGHAETVAWPAAMGLAGFVEGGDHAERDRKRDGD